MAGRRLESGAQRTVEAALRRRLVPRLTGKLATQVLS
jgi:hypothetical protein